MVIAEAKYSQWPERRDEKKISERICCARAGQIESVGIMRFQVALDIGGLVIFIREFGGDLRREVARARIERRNL